MSQRRVLSLWFPRLEAERYLRLERGTVMGPLAVVKDDRGAQVLHSISAEASAAGLRQGQPLRDAMAMCPRLLTRPHVPRAESALLTALRRWAGKFSPWVAEEPHDGLVIDLTGCAHLFGGEQQLVMQVAEDCRDLGLSVRIGIADTLGAAWALARFTAEPTGTLRSGDAIDQEARATRSRAAKRRSWDLGLTTTKPMASPGRIAAPGQTRQAIAHLPVTALRISEADATGLARLGLRRIGDLTGMPRAALARRFGMSVGQRLDQALGIVPEPVSPAKPEDLFATRLTLPDPIGLRDDIEAGIDRLLPPLLAKLRKAGRGVRRIRLQAFRTDHGIAEIDVGLARPSAEPDRIKPLLCMKLDDIDAGHGIDSLRLEAHVTEPIHARQMKGHLDAARDVSDRLTRNTGLDDLIGRLGARIGMEAITRLHPADSHIPEKTHQTLAAAWSEPVEHWPPSPTPRPLVMWPPEPVHAPETPVVPDMFRWRRREWRLAQARGPERLAPEWWLDDPAWRSGVRDYWEVTTQSGARLWLYFAHGGTASGGWFCQGSFD